MLVVLKNTQHELLFATTCSREEEIKWKEILKSLNTSKEQQAQNLLSCSAQQFQAIKFVSM